MKYNSQKFLKKISAIEDHIEQLKYELSELEKTRVYVRAVNYGANGIAGGSKKSEAAFEKTADKIADLELEVNREIENLAEQRNAAIHLIQRLDDPRQSKILFMRYLQKKTFGEIESDVGIAQSYLYVIHRKALVELDKIFAQ